MNVDLASLEHLTRPIKEIKQQLLTYLNGKHADDIKIACFGALPLDELLTEQVQEEVCSLLKIVNRFKEELAMTYTSLQYGEPQMDEEDTSKKTEDHAPECKEDSKHWEGVALELKHD